MNNGGWIPISRHLARHLPTDREYTVLEALYCLQLDHADGKSASVAGYAALWRWSRRRVSDFLSSVGAEIAYSRQYSRSGGVVVWAGCVAGSGQDPGRIRAGSGQDRLINCSDLRGQVLQDAGRFRAGSGQVPGRMRCTTNNNNIDTESSSSATAKRRKQPAADLDSLRPDWWTPEQWQSLREHRRAVKATETTIAYKTLIKEFEVARQAGETPDMILGDMSAGKGWIGYKLEWVCNRRKQASVASAPSRQGVGGQPVPRTIREAAATQQAATAEYLLGLLGGGEE